LVGFILMVDEFRADNGATRFVPGSHRLLQGPGGRIGEGSDDPGGQVAACGPAGSILIFDGSVWHGHGANRSAGRRRSIQGAPIPREARAAVDQAARIRPETSRRIGDLAKYVLNLGPAG
jgi:ectoine hydroxylase-related dioxygenase (phytanoyl-CoA dioxygenase family)